MKRSNSKVGKQTFRAAAMLALVGLALALLASSGSAQEPQDTVTSGGGGTTHTVTWFSALWRAETPKTTLVFADDRVELEAKMQQLATEGLRLEDFESWLEKDERRFAGLFRAGSGDRVLRVDLDAASFEAQRQQRLAEGLRLLDVEIRQVDGERRYSALWAPGKGVEQLDDDMSVREFHNRREQLAASHHLVDFETWWQAGGVRVFALWRTGVTPGEVVEVGLDRDAFHAQVVARGSQNMKLIDVEIAVGERGDDRYSGRWIPGTSADWFGLGYSRPVLLRADQLLSQGYGTSGFGLPSDSLLTEPTAPRLGLLDLEVVSRTGSGSIIQENPLHDSGTAGPPP